MNISVPSGEKLLENDREYVDCLPSESFKDDLSSGPIIMNAIRDDETGEMVATDVINASTVVARFRNVAERNGYVTIGFDVTVPSDMSDSGWQLKLYPEMRILDDTLRLDAIFITGKQYRAEQLRGYQRYEAFLASIIKDTSDMVRVGQLEIFLKRYFPDTYAMKTDSSFISDPVAESCFGVTQTEALRHYTRHIKVNLNERRKARSGMMYSRYVRDPIVREGVRLDTVVNTAGGDFVYRYDHTFRSRPGLKKVMVNMNGEIYQDGALVGHLPFNEELTFYISSLSTLVDQSPKFRTVILERNVCDNTKAFIDFRQGSSEIDTSLSDNASEIERIIRCIGDVADKDELVLDSLIIMASCSPEGTSLHNESLSAARAESVRKHFWPYFPEDWRNRIRTSCVPENWKQLKLLVANDTVMTQESRIRILKHMDDLGSPDDVESSLSAMGEYRYLREKLYPRLRSVGFDFYLHRSGMQKDTVHTTELDTVYMSGVEALKNMDYKCAVERLGPYKDYNSALALLSAGYDDSALLILDGQDERDPGICYLKALACSRLERWDEALGYYEKGISLDPDLRHRANLDPEMSYLLNYMKTNQKQNYYE